MLKSNIVHRKVHVKKQYRECTVSPQYFQCWEVCQNLNVVSLNTFLSLKKGTSFAFLQLDV